jgi:hypothetical protein
MRAKSFALIITSLLGSILLLGGSAHATKYGAGSYGRCQYETCAISLASSTNVSVNVIPSAAGVRCTVASDSVTVTTSSSTGYTLSLIDNDSTTTLTGTGSPITSSSGTFISPVTLGANMWGYRLDNAGGFGAGPTSSVSNTTTPALTFAGLQPSTGTADQVVNASTAATSGVTTPIWYGLCVTASQASGSYSDSVLYTALIN